MNERDHTFLRLAREDCEVSRLPSLRTLSARLRGPKRHRMPDACALLLAAPGDAERTELYVWTLLNLTARQIGGTISLGPTFIRAVSEIEPDVREALSDRTMAALEQLAQLAKEAPVPLPEDCRMLAHALVIDGELVAWLNEKTGMESERKQESAQQAYRRLAQQHHPDRGGDGRIMAALNELWRAVKTSG